MKSFEEIKAEFVKVYENTVRLRGLPTNFGRIMAILTLEGRALSHKEISSLTGYSLSSVSRTLELMIQMGIAYKHKSVEPKHFVYQLSGNFPEMLAYSWETRVKTFEVQMKDAKKLLQNLIHLQSEGSKRAEINRIINILETMNKTMEYLDKSTKNAIEELRDLAKTF